MSVCNNAFHVYLTVGSLASGQIFGEVLYFRAFITKRISRKLAFESNASRRKRILCCTAVTRATVVLERISGPFVGTWRYLRASPIVPGYIYLTSVRCNTELSISGRGTVLVAMQQRAEASEPERDN